MQDQSKESMPKNKAVAVRLPVTMISRIEEVAEQDDRDKSYILRQVVDFGMSKLYPETDGSQKATPKQAAA